MKKRLIIDVENCEACLWYGDYWGGICDHPDFPQRPMVPPRGVPSWCPLPDAKEEDE